MKKISLFCAICVTFCLISCGNMEIVSTELYVEPSRVWTTIVYMAADNNLEGAAIQDLNELESISVFDSGMTVLVLLDRAEGEDGTNGDWTDTRLFEVKKDPEGKNGTIVSKRLECSELNLFTDSETELNMGEPGTLSGLIDFAKRKYTADHYALIMWGHGNGWRGMNSGETEKNNSRAMAIDKKTDSYMSVPKFGGAIKDKGIDVIAFDTCFGALIELFYEVKESASYLVGSAGIVPVDGFDYSKFLSAYNDSDKTPSAVASCIANSSGQPVSIVKTDSVSQIAFGINDLSRSISRTITTKEIRDETYNLFLYSIDSYNEASYPSDYFIDVYDFAKKYSASEDSEIKTLANELKNYLENAIITTGVEEPQIGIYFGELLSKKSLSPSYPEHYINGISVNDKSSFVNEMTGWVPTENKNISLLDKIFNVIF